jgi:enoyl-CoA hydratase/carnithine racemase
MTTPGPGPLEIERRGAVVVLRFNRARKRNAVNDALIGALDEAVLGLDPAVRVLVLAGAGEHFCAGLDLSEHKERDAFATVEHSRMWHRVLDGLQYGTRPVVAALHGAVIGGGLEIASACHVRVADKTTFYQLPEGRRGIFVGGGASVRTARIIGTGRMVEMMLTGRTLDAATGQTLGLSHELVEPGQAFLRALELAEIVAGNAPMSNYMILQALARIADMPAEGGLLTESFAAALTQTSADARRGIQAFLDKKTAKFGE